MSISIKEQQQVEHMRESGRILAQTLSSLKAEVRVGVSPKELAGVCAKLLSKAGAEPAFLNYQGFPDVICISVNDEVVHGIPGPRLLESGDVLSLDLGVKYKGLITDAAVTVVVGEKISAEQQQLLTTTEAALLAGIAKARKGNRVGDISQAIETELVAGGLGIIRTLFGHGVGLKVHEDPEIPNFSRSDRGTVLLEGMTLAIEPMATLGSEEVLVDHDNWTIRTRDKSLSAHFEHTVLITGSEPEILTSI